MDEELMCDDDGNIAVHDIINSVNLRVMTTGDAMLGPLEVVAGATGTQAMQASEIEQKILDATEAIEPTDITLSPDGRSIVKADGTRVATTLVAAVHFNGFSTVPEIQSSYNIRSIDRLANGHYRIFFEEPMDHIKFTAVGNSDESNAFITVDGQALDSFKCMNYSHKSGRWVNDNIDVLVFGGID